MAVLPWIWYGGGDIVPIVFSCDSNWVVAISGVGILAQLIGSTTEIYTFTQDDPRVDASVVDVDQYASFNNLSGVTINYTGIESATGFIWVPLMNVDARLTSAEISNLVSNAQEYGAFLTGEHDQWGGAGGYNAHLVTAFRPDWADGTTTGTTTVNMRVPPNPRDNWGLGANQQFGEFFQGRGFFNDGVVPDESVIALTNESLEANRRPTLVDMRQY